MTPLETGRACVLEMIQRNADEAKAAVERGEQDQGAVRQEMKRMEAERDAVTQRTANPLMLAVFCRWFARFPVCSPHSFSIRYEDECELFRPAQVAGFRGLFAAPRALGWAA